jgi:hypothetical protein
MGDIPHGWAAAEFVLLLRDALFFEVDEDDDPHVYLAPGLLPRWVGNGEAVTVTNAPTTFGTVFGYTLQHDATDRTVTIRITQPLPPAVRFVFPCRFGSGVRSVTVDGAAAPVAGKDVSLPASTKQAVIAYS